MAKVISALEAEPAEAEPEPAEITLKSGRSILAAEYGQKVHGPQDTETCDALNQSPDYCST